MKSIIKFLSLLIICFSFAEIVKADSAPPSKQTTFNFKQNNQPIIQPVNFNIKCYGTSLLRGGEEGIRETEEILKISELSETCTSYGCKFDTSNIFGAYRKSIKYCDLEGDVDGQKFKINNFLGDDLNELNCHKADFSIMTNDRYYKETEKYNECRKEVYREYYPQGDGEVKGEFLCAKFKTDDKLIKTDISVEQNGPCYRYGYTIKDGICYRIPQEFFDCTAEKQTKMDLCDLFREDVTNKLAKTEDGYAFEEICEINTNLPVTVVNTDNPQINDETVSEDKKHDDEQSSISGNTENVTDKLKISYGLLFILSLLLTLALELPILIILGKYLLKIEVPVIKILFCGLLVNLFSLPYLWFIFPLFITSSNYIIFGELSVVLIEMLLLFLLLKVRFRDAFILSVVANAVSYFIGLIVF
ncbi:MAG: hypothetical protein GF353_11090 [Candidatus Lokiarchaeota archaeon]|nr:hypothetical protein [Candidatus Lokiarchaeota archaeon]